MFIHVLNIRLMLDRWPTPSSPPRGASLSHSQVLISCRGLESYWWIFRETIRFFWKTDKNFKIIQLVQTEMQINFWFSLPGFLFIIQTFIISACAQDGKQDKLASVLLWTCWTETTRHLWLLCMAARLLRSNMLPVITVLSQWKETDTASVFLTSRACLSLTELMNHSLQWRRERRWEATSLFTESEPHTYIQCE